MMKSMLFIVLFFYVFCIVSSEQQYIYTIQYLKSYRRDTMSKYLGCNHQSIAFGTYTYPMGVKDALYVFLNQGTYQSYVNCPFKHVYVKLFGTEQDYNQILNAEPGTVADRVKQMTSRINPNYIVDWNCPMDKDIGKARNWLNTFVEKLSGNTQVYVKAPASYFCYLVDGQKYLLDLNKVSKYIIKMHGQEPGVYTTYEDMFQKQHPRETNNKDKYSQKCPIYPSYKTLVDNNPGKQFFIEKTLQKEEPGYIGPKFSKFLEDAKSIYGKQAFLDSFPEQIIQL